MGKSNLRRILSSISLLLSLNMALAETFVAVDKPAKIFDEPNVKGYVTLNTKNQEVTPSPGMVFKSLENSNGWHLVEYSPGLRGYISDQRLGTPTHLPKAGVYKVSNKAGATIKVSSDGNAWTAEINGHSYRGTVNGNIVVFMTPDNQQAYSLVDFGDGPIAICYDNDCTGFF